MAARVDIEEVALDSMSKNFVLYEFHLSMFHIVEWIIRFNFSRTYSDFIIHNFSKFNVSAKCCLSSSKEFSNWSFLIKV